MINALDLVGKRYANVQATGYMREVAVIGAPYLLTREWADGHVVIARRRGSNPGIVVHDGSNWYATPINPPVQVGDQIFGLERGGGGNPLRKDRRRTVVAVSDAGVLAKYSTYEPIPITAWVKAEGRAADPVRDRHNPERRKLVLDRLSREGMDRIGDTGYATSAAEFFKHFDLPRPKVRPTAVLDLERQFDYNSLPRDSRYMMDDAGITSLRTGMLKGRAKVKLAESECRCKEITPEEATAAWPHSGTWTVVKVHKVECLWCTEIARIDEVV